MPRRTSETLRALPGADGAARSAIAGDRLGARLATRAARAVSSTRTSRRVAGFRGGRPRATDAARQPTRSGCRSARAEFVFGHADGDRGMPPDAVERLGRALDAAGLTATNEIYPDAPHGYSMNDTSMYREAGAERSFRELEALLGRTLRHVDGA